MRMVNIGFNVQTSKAVSELAKLKKDLEGIQKVVLEINKQKIDLGINSENFNSISKATEKVTTSIDKLKTSAKELNGSFDINGSGLIKTKDNMGALNRIMKQSNPNKAYSINKDTINSYAQLYAVVRLLKVGFDGFMKLEDATYNLGVVAQMSNVQIQGLRQTMIDMGQDVPVKITEITKAMNETMRTGKTYAESLNLVNQASKLAVASGEDLADSMQIINKIFVALKINANNAQDVADAMQNLHATATFTATDLQGLGNSAKQWVNSLPFHTNSNKRGVIKLVA